MPDNKIFLDKYEQKCYCCMHRNSILCCDVDGHNTDDNDNCKNDNFLLSEEFAVHECELDEE